MLFIFLIIFNTCGNTLIKLSDNVISKRLKNINRIDFSVNNSVNTGDITEKHNSQVDEGQQETTVKPESNNAENYDDQVMALADDNYEPFTLASTPDSVAAANSDDDNNFIFYVSLIGLVAVAAVLLIIRLTVKKKDGEPFRLFGKRKGDK